MVDLAVWCISAVVVLLCATVLLPVVLMFGIGLMGLLLVFIPGLFFVGVVLILVQLLVWSGLAKT